MPGEYTIAGGLADAQRLARQAHVMASQSSAFLSRIGLASGWACLDVGCGDGQVTLAMARAAGPSGRAVGVDMDAEALAIAREAAMRAGVRAEFLQADAVCPIETEAFDLAYARLLLSHLIDPSDAELEALEGRIAEAAREPTTVFYQARVHQVSGRRPECSAG